MFDVFVVGPAKQFVGPFKNDFAVAEHDKARIRDTHEIVLGLKSRLTVAVGSVFRC
jgi:hypothetical protein